MRVSKCLIFAAVLLCSPAPTTAREPETRAVQQAALAPLGELIGSWRGVGQPRRGSSQGAWIETAEAAWRFDAGRVAIVLTSKEGKFHQSLEIRPGPEADTFLLTTIRAAEQGDDKEITETFLGRRNERGDLECVAERDTTAADRPARISLRLVAGGDRLVLLYEARAPGTDRYRRLAEVGYTRRGRSLAKGTGQPECIVTGGHGEITVEHAGKQYYVCCGGCRDLFLDDPEGVIAEYLARKNEQRAEP